MKLYLNPKCEHFVHKKMLKLYLNYLEFDKSISQFCIEELNLNLTIDFDKEQTTCLNQENEYVIKRLSWILYLDSINNLKNQKFEMEIKKLMTNFNEFNMENFIQFFSGDDKFLIKFLILMIKLYQNMMDMSYKKILNPILIFYQFLCFLDFDHEICFEFLISNETNFLEYLLLIFKYKQELISFEYKEEIYEFLLTFENQIKSYQKNNIFPYNSKLLISKLKEFTS